MSNFLKTAALLLCSFFALQAQAQSVSSVDQKGVEATFNAFTTAFDKMDAAAIGPLLTENSEVISPMGEITRGRVQLVAMYNGLFNYFKSLPQPDRFERKDLNWQSRYLANDLILVTYTEDSVSYFGERKEVEKMSQAIALRKTGDKWLAEMVALTPVAAMPGSGK